MTYIISRDNHDEYPAWRAKRSKGAMKAVFITKPGGPEVLEIREVPTPQPSAEELLVRVHAAGINRADLLQCQGKYPAPPDAPQEIPGLEFAGEVEAIG